MGNPSRSSGIKMNGLLIYWGGTVYFLSEAAYDWFGRHNGVKALSDLVAVVIGLFFIWYGRYVWSSLKRAFSRPRNDPTTGRR
jgi:hypothetical protein